MWCCTILYYVHGCNKIYMVQVAYLSNIMCYREHWSLVVWKNTDDAKHIDKFDMCKTLFHRLTYSTIIRHSWHVFHINLNFSANFFRWYLQVQLSVENNVTIYQGESTWKLNLFEPFLNRLHCPNSPLYMESFHWLDIVTWMVNT